MRYIQLGLSRSSPYLLDQSYCCMVSVFNYSSLYTNLLYLGLYHLCNLVGDFIPVQLGRYTSRIIKLFAYGFIFVCTVCLVFGFDSLLNFPNFLNFFFFSASSFHHICFAAILNLRTESKSLNSLTLDFLPFKGGTDSSGKYSFSRKCLGISISPWPPFIGPGI